MLASSIAVFGVLESWKYKDEKLLSGLWVLSFSNNILFISGESSNEDVEYDLMVLIVDSSGYCFLLFFRR